MQNFPSVFAIGDPVQIISFTDGKPVETGLHGHIRAVLFTNGKVRYSVRVMIDSNGDVDDCTTFHNLDSIVVVSWEEGEKITTSFDNYS
jgi:hypothetical protein